jgi:hypothetical protein
VVWTNAAAKVYHGTTESAARSIVLGGVNPSFGRGAADFGQGFYVTSDLHQARQWANQKVRASTGSHNAAVLEFDLDRDKLASHGDHLTFILPDSAFHDFVLFNRLGGSNHYRAGGSPYDVVYGPVAAFPQTIIYANCDQICFVAAARPSALAALGAPNSAFQIGNPYF